jgi:hypothetical protein
VLPELEPALEPELEPVPELVPELVRVLELVLELALELARVLGLRKPQTNHPPMPLPSPKLISVSYSLFSSSYNVGVNLS